MKNKKTNHIMKNAIFRAVTGEETRYSNVNCFNFTLSTIDIVCCRNLHDFLIYVAKLRKSCKFLQHVSLTSAIHTCM